jgi:hypothetical protein
VQICHFDHAPINGRLSIPIYVPDTYWAQGYIGTVYQAGITKGYGGTDEFRPDLDVTRDQMAAFIIRTKEGEPAANYCDSGSPFTDVDPSSWSYKYIKRLYELDITTGYGGADQ